MAINPPSTQAAQPNLNNTLLGAVKQYFHKNSNKHNLIFLHDLKLKENEARFIEKHFKRTFEYQFEEMMDPKPPLIPDSVIKGMINDFELDIEKCFIEIINVEFHSTSNYMSNGIEYYFWVECLIFKRN